MSEIKHYLEREFHIDEEVWDLVREAESKVMSKFLYLDEIMEWNQYKVLKSFQENRISDVHFRWNTGYGYDDPGREAIEKVYSSLFRTEAALVRPTIVNGTHALTLMFSGISFEYFMPRFTHLTDVFLRSFA